MNLFPRQPLLAMPNVILTGHIGLVFGHVGQGTVPQAVTQVIDVLKGKWPIYAVNPEARSRWVDRWGIKDSHGYDRKIRDRPAKVRSWLGGPFLDAVETRR